MRKDFSSLVVLDVETTGLNPESDNIIEVAIVKFENDEIVDKLVSLINPGREIPVEAKIVNGIDESMLENQPKFKDIVKEIKKFLKGKTVIIHNSDFDISFLKKEFQLCGEEFPEFDVIDTLYIARKYFNFPSNSLSSLAENYEIGRQPHRAEKDAIIAYRIFEHFREELGENIYEEKFSSLEVGNFPLSEGTFKIKVLIEESIENEEEIVIKYRNRNGVETERKIKPVEIINKNGRMFVKAFCYARKEDREFRLDRIIKIEDNVKEG